MHAEGINESTFQRIQEDMTKPMASASLALSSRSTGTISGSLAGSCPGPPPGNHMRANRRMDAAAMDDLCVCGVWGV